MPNWELAGYRISCLTSELFRLDGGAMFGSVPKALWSRAIPADEANRIPLACRLLILEGHGRRILVDTGMGTDWSPKEREIYAIEPLMESSLAECCGAVTDVILTHLHFDHAGGICRLENSQAIPTFPNAKIHLSRTNWERARNPSIRERASYLPRFVEALEGADIQWCEDGAEILPGIHARLASGHTDGMMWLQVGSGTGSVVFPSDLVPTACHLPLPYIMGYDMCAATTIREKEAFLDCAVEEEWVVVFEHDAHTAAATIGRNSKGHFEPGRVWGAHGLENLNGNTAVP